MTVESDSSARGVVWATVFLTALNLFGIATIVFLDIKNPVVFEPVAVALLVGTAPALVTVPMLLGCSELKPGWIVTGRVLMWVQSLAILVAVILAVIVVIRGSL